MFGRTRRSPAPRLHEESRAAALEFVTRIARQSAEPVGITRAALTHAAMARQAKHTVRVDPV